jgi:hypothetical protein
MDLEKLIKDKRNIKENSIRSYLIILKRLNDNKEILNLGYLKDTKNIESKIREKALTTQRNYLGAILVILSAYNKAEFDPALQFYRDMLDELNEKYQEQLKSHEKDPKQSKNWVSLDILKKAMNRLKKDIDERGILEKDSLNNKELMLLQRYVVASLYLLQPPIRLDFSMDIVSKRSDIKDGTNYLLNQGRNKKKFIFTEYKTSKSYDTKEVDLNSKLNKVMNIWLKYNKSPYLLLNNRGGKLSSNGLGKLIPKVFETTNKHITLNLIRHIYISENVDLEAVKKAKQLAEDMLHSKEMQIDYIKK